VLEITRPLTVASYDVDYGGVVSNIVYVRWLEDMRHALIDRVYSFARQQQERIAPAVVETSIRYHRPLRFLDRPQGRLWVTSAGPVRLSFSGEITLDGAPAAQATQVCAFIDLDTGRPRRLPREFDNAFPPG
jgi:acyl-CoA thioester hydrolase